MASEFDMMGDNLPPDDANPLEDRLREAYGDLFRRWSELEVEALEAPLKVESDEQAEALTALAARIKAVEDQLEAARVQEKEPFFTSAKVVDDTLGAPRKAAEAKRKSLVERQNAWLRVKRQREQEEAARRAEQARRDAEDAAARAREAKALEMPSDAKVAEQEAGQLTRHADAMERRAATATGRVSAGGATVGQKRVRMAEVVDRPALEASLGPLAKWLPWPMVLDAVQRARLGELGAPFPTIPGVRFWEDVQATMRTARRS